MTEEQIQNAIRKVGMFGILGFPDAGTLVKAVETLQQQNKQLIEAIGLIQQQVSIHSSGYALNVYKLCEDALQQIQGDEGE